MAQATNRAFADERRTAIMEMLEHNASVQVAEIAQTFGVSSVTARSDLDALAEAGKLRRTHGGAVSLQKRLTVSTSPPSRLSRKAPSSSSMTATRC